MRRRILITTAACALALGGGSAFGQSHAVPRARAVSRAARTAPVARRPVWVWLAPWDNSAAVASTVAHADLIGRASPFWYELVGDSGIYSTAPSDASAEVDTLRAHHLEVIPSVTESDGMAAFTSLMANASERAAAVSALVSLAREPGFSGLDLDFESFAIDPHRSRGLADRAAGLYAGFVGQICRALHHAGRSCYLTVMSRTGPAHVFLQEGTATWVYDYRALAAVSDGVQVMAYDEHNPLTKPGPVAGLPWVRRVVAYARSQMPGNRTQLGLAAYGYDWGSNGHVISLASRQSPGFAAEYGAHLSWSAAQAEETFSYHSGRTRYVDWFEDPRSEAMRASLAKSSGFAGVALWAVSDESGMLWPRLARVYAR